LAVAVTDLVLPRFTEPAPGGGLSQLQTIFGVLSSLVLYGIFLLYQTLGEPMIFQQPEAPAGSSAQAAHHGLGHHSTGFHVASLLLALLPLVLMSKTLAVYVEFGIAQIGAPVALSGFLVAIMILTPEALAAFRAARSNQMQRAVNICLGSALATIGLTVPAVLISASLVGLPIELGLAMPEIVLLALTLAISIMTFAGTRPTAIQGVVQLVVFFTYVMLNFDR
jgi:Ca2+:H+ antiporter